MPAGANAFALRVPVQGVTRTGGRHRNSPTGGAANGTPLYTLKPPSRTPDIAPDSVGVLKFCASVTEDVVGTTKRIRARVKTLQEYIANRFLVARLPLQATHRTYQGCGLLGCHFPLSGLLARIGQS